MANTRGLSAELIESFLHSDPNLDIALNQAIVARDAMSNDLETLLLELDEAQFSMELQKTSLISTSHPQSIHTSHWRPKAHG